MYFTGMVPNELAEATEKVWRAFANVPLGELEGCPCCIKGHHYRALVEVPRREIRDISFYAYKAMTTFGNEQNFQYFLPRILASLADNSIGINEEIVANKLAMARWQTWPDRLRKPVEAWFLAYFRAALASYPYPGHAETALSVLLLAGFELKPLLELWSNDPTPGALRERFIFAFHWQQDPELNSFLENLDQARLTATIQEWIHSDDTDAALRQAESMGLIQDEDQVLPLEAWWH